MFIILALLAFVNAKKDVYMKEEGDGLISNDDVGSSSNDGMGPVLHKKIVSYLALILENFNDVLNDGINKTTFTKYFDDEDEEESMILDKYIEYINLISNKSLILYPNRWGEYSQYVNVSKTLSSISDSIKDFLDSHKDAFRTIQPIISELGPDLASVINIDFNTLNELYKYILIEQTDGVRFGKLLEILGLSTNWVTSVQNVISVFDDSKPISNLFEGLGVTNEYNDLLNKIILLNISTNENEKFLSIDNAANAIISAIKLVRSAYNNFIKKHYDDVILPLIKKYGLKPANIFEKSINTRANSIVKIMNKIQSYSSGCSNKDIKESASLNDYKCMIYSFAKEYLGDNFKGFISDYTNAEINLTSFLIDKYELNENTVKLISGLIADAMDPSKNYIDALENSAKYLSNVKVFGISYPQFSKTVKYVAGFICGLSDSSNFYQLFSNLGITQYWNTAVKYVQDVSVEKPMCNLSFLHDDEYFEYCQEDFDKYVQYIKHYLSDKANLTEFLGNGEGNYSQIIINAVPVLKDLTNALPVFLNSAYEKAVPDLILGYINVTMPKKADFTKFVTKTSEIIDEMFSLIDFLFPCAARELPVVSKYYPMFIQKTHQILGAFKDSKTTIPSIANTFYDGIGVIFNMLESAASAFKDVNTTIISIVNAAKPTTFLDLGKTAAELIKIDNLTLNNIAKAITYDGSSNGAKLLADPRTLTINDVAPYKTLVLNSEELYNNMKQRKLDLNLISKSLGSSKEGLKEMLTSIVSPVIAIPRQFILNIVKNYTRSNDDQVVSYFDKIRFLARSVETGALISTYTDGIQPTPVQTPESTPLPPRDDGYEELDDAGETDFITSNDATEIKNALNEMFQDQSSKSIGKINLDESVESITLNNDILQGLEDKYIKLNKDVPIILENGKLNLGFDDEVDKATVSVKENTNIQLSIKTSKKGSTSDADDKKPKVIEIITESDQPVKIMSASELTVPVEIKVPEQVKSVTIDSVQLFDRGKISASNTEGESVQVNVNKLNATANTEATLENVAIENEFNIATTASLNLKDVKFNTVRTVINVDLDSYKPERFTKPLFTGDLSSPPSLIVLGEPTLGNDNLAEGEDYVLFRGLFENGCAGWREALDISKTNFEVKECADSASNTNILASEYKSLNVKRNPPPGDSESGGKLSAGQIAGIVVGCVVGVAIIVTVVVIVVIKKKKNNQQSSNENENENEKDDHALPESVSMCA